MSLTKRIYIKDITPKTVLQDECFLVLSKDRQLTRSNRPYLSITFGDMSGKIEARLWDDADSWAQRFEKGKAALVQAVGVEYQGRTQLKVDAIESLPDEEAPWEVLIPTSKYDLKEMESEARSFVDNMHDPWIQALCRVFIDDERIWKTFCLAPAAKSIHHAWRGGLLEHTLAVMRLCSAVASLYPDVNEDLLLCGALLHDIGKTVELGAGPVVEYSDRGRLVGHLAIGLTWISDKAREIDGFPQTLVWHIQHLLASHHGTREQGAIQLPMTLEAEILSLADLLDSRLEGYRNVMESDNGDPQSNWTTFQRIYDRYLFRGPRSWNDQGSTAREQGAEELVSAPERGYRSGKLFDDLDEEDV